MTQLKIQLFVCTGTLALILSTIDFFSNSTLARILVALLPDPWLPLKIFDFLEFLHFANSIDSLSNSKSTHAHTVLCNATIMMLTSMFIKLTLSII